MTCKFMKRFFFPPPKRKKEISQEICTLPSTVPREVGLWNKVESSTLNKQILALEKLKLCSNLGNIDFCPSILPPASPLDGTELWFFKKFIFEISPREGIEFSSWSTFANTEVSILLLFSNVV